MHGIVQFLSMATTAQTVSTKGCCAGLALYILILRPCSHFIFVDNVVDNNTQKRKSVGSGSISHLNDISCGCKVDIGNVFSNGPYQTRLVRPTFTLCSPDIYVINASELPQFFTTLPLILSKQGRPGNKVRPSSPRIYLEAS